MSEIKYKIKKSFSTKRLRISVFPEGRVVVSAPAFLSSSYVERFVEQKMDWINSKLEHFAKNPVLYIGNKERKLTKKDYLENKDGALVLVLERLAHFNKFYNFEFINVTIRNQKTRWGSCSKQKNLNFNYKIVFLTPEQQNYIIVHEICHLSEMNHGKNFWALVEKQIPEYKKIRTSIRKYRL